MKTKTQHTSDPVSGFYNLAATEFRQALISYGYSELRIDQVIRAVNNHEALLEALKHCLRIPGAGIDSTDQETGETYRFGIEKAIAQAEGK